ncbi:dTDP-4-dehydrorhamnose 3,5-epimerase [Pseudohongiella spirulinae]|uniref:dTDP-4-dehydrorhamnose 3,5-epimerase n=1 Tax=Pseudohongiella spirulinae TaxID=1249552 RepID=A0A0S2KE67_9GAMM|nr:dTDP-4-dehydrorhamnose 3,5-epimerase [Pseudohongiella spirulinae]ALO46414.1 dTDP-4-dehydrorhamnose 3,5-epimerase [Pseudohongiella spirulinae]
MKITETQLAGVYEIENSTFRDERGFFVKTFHRDTFKKYGLTVVFEESFYSISKKNVLRGMHFQKTPDDHAKLVYVVAGEILDVVVDIREGSNSFGHWYETLLSAENKKSLYLDKGLAHGFLTLSDSATVVYMTSTQHSPKADSGIKWDSFGFGWPISNPIISERDKNFPGLY